ncbi:MAG: hypothetical protein IKC32_02315 [Clostridia bacterium]|nr:hypothetical protein [Clostridia bacterium]
MSNEMIRRHHGRTVRVSVMLIAAAMLAALLPLLAACAPTVETVDYMNDDLSQFVYIDEKHYKDYPVELVADPIDDVAIDTAIMQALYTARQLEAVYNGKYYSTLPRPNGVVRTLGIGDTVYIRYIGYEIDEDGERIYFDGGCNFADESSMELGLGSGSLITGFELGLVGKDPADYSTLTEVTDRPIEKGNVISLSMLTIMADGSSTSKKSYMIKVDPEICDPVYGEGFADFLIGKGLGKTGKNFTFTTEGVSGSSVYTDISVDKIFDVGGEPMTVEARFPAAYDTAELAGKTVYFDVYFEKAQLYVVPELTVEFITEKYNITEEELAAYGEAGADFKDCYREFLKEQLKKMADEDAKSIITAAMWDWYMEKAVVKRLPKDEVEDYYNDYVRDLEDKYNSVSSSGEFSSFDEFAETYVLPEEGETWRDKLRRAAEDSVAEKLVFYYVIRREGFLPNDEEFDELYDKIVDEMLTYVLDNVGFYDKEFASEEARQEELEAYRQVIIDGYGAEYFNENVIYEFAIEKLVGLAKVTYK